MALEPVDTKTDDASSYKGNDIDSDGDGVVDEADHASTADSAGDADTLDGQQPGALSVDHAATAGDADTVDGNDAGAFADAGHSHSGGEIDPETATIGTQLTVPVFATTGDVPTLPEGSIVFVSGDGLYVENGQ